MRRTGSRFQGPKKLPPRRLPLHFKNKQKVKRKFLVVGIHYDLVNVGNVVRYKVRQVQKSEEV